MRGPPGPIRRSARFRVRELAATLALFALGAAVVTPELRHRAALRRDALRLAELRRAQDAIERYHEDADRWPTGDAETDAEGWDSSANGAFLPELLAQGYLDRALCDPLEHGRFRLVYRRLAPDACPCVGPDGGYVLGLRAFETAVYAARRPGTTACAHGTAGNGLAHVSSGGVDWGADRP